MSNEFEIPSGEKGSFPALQGKVAIVTGGSSGIGLSAAKILLQNGAIVVIADLNAVPTMAFIEAGHQWTFLRKNVVDFDQLRSLFESTFKQHGKIDIVIVNAGVTDRLIQEDVFADTFDRDGKLLPPKSQTMDVNFTGGLNTIKLGLHYFAKNPTPGGKIVVTGSQACFVDEDLPMYLASKYALRGLMRGIYSNAPKFNVSINMVAPSATETGMMPPGARQALEEMGFVFNDSDAVGRAIAFLAVGEKDEGGVEKWNGKTIYIAGNTFREVEDGFDASRAEYLGGNWIEMATKMRALGFSASKSGW